MNADTLALRIRQALTRNIAIASVGIVLSTLVAISLINSAGAAVSLRGVSVADTGTGAGTSLNFTTPTNTQLNDVMIAVISVRGGTATTITATGWTLINSNNSGTNLKSSVYYRVASASEGAQTFSFASQKASGIIASYSGVDTADPINAQANVVNGSSASMTAPSITTTVPNAMLVAMYSAMNGSAMGPTGGSGMTLQATAASSGGNTTTRTSTGLQDAVQVSPAVTGTKTLALGTAAISIGHHIALRPSPVISQSKFRFFANSDSTTASTPLAAIDTGASVAKQTAFRLRLNLGVANGESNMTAVAARTFKLQFATRGADGICDTSFTNETYTDVSISTGVQFFNNPTPADGATYVASANDPTRGLTNVLQYYEETAPMGVRLAAAANQDAHWDIAMTTSASATEGAYYCFRVVNGDGTNLTGTYSVIPQLYIQPPTITQSNYRWYPNADSTAPGAPTVAQNTATTVAPSTPFRLRQRLAVDSAQLGASTGSYKLQYAEKNGTCSASFGGTLFLVNNPPVQESQWITGGQVVSNDTSYGTVAWTNPGNITFDDGLNASVSTTDASADTNYLFVTNYGFSIPAGATITGIDVYAENGGSINKQQSSVRLVKSGVIQPVDRATPGQPLYNTVFGSSTDLWGDTWTPDDINNSGFGVAFAVRIFAGEGNTVDYVGIEVYYTPAGSGVPGAISYHDNPSPSTGATISASNDPTGRTTVYQTYNETDPYSNSVAAIAAGSDGLWDFSLTSSPDAAGKTYCFRTVKADGTPLDTYSTYPEITFAAGNGPSLSQQVRGGASVVNGTKSPLTF